MMAILLQKTKRLATNHFDIGRRGWTRADAIRRCAGNSLPPRNDSDR
jgi:hypothetical protein